MSSTGLPATTSRRGLVVGLVLGLPLLAWGVRGILLDAARTHPAELVRWVVGAALITDLVVVPGVVVAASAARRITPARWWPAVRAALTITGSLALVAWPFVRGYGRDPANPSLLPRDYAGGLAAAVAAVWLVTAASLAPGLRRCRARSRRAARCADRRYRAGTSIVGAHGRRY
jgi:hypothetical protein